MTLHSMTGFARRSVEGFGQRYAWELKTVNARGLDIRLRLPPGLDHLEAAIRQTARDSLTRGTCQFALTREAAEDIKPLRLNEAGLALVLTLARRLANEEGIAPPTADGILRIPGVLEEMQPALSPDAEAVRDAAIIDGFGEAILALSAARGEEGARLGQILSGLLDAIERLVGRAAALGAEAPDLLRQRIADQVAALVSAGGGLDPERLHQEAILAATRADVREEIDRLRSHVQSARARLAEGGPVGRRLDFLAQEFNREANTLCAKAFDSRLSAVGLELKTAVDQFREQVQNLE
ncbi:YicC/YloC family endoribonuclease [Faunimonas sp. B44]|uniref:YicC/YloC family endoribonuclease n=1 Tax=Faunimonas sp. B44 TaxID=3461493 RepID=UPI00404437D7